jgi:hypothetical protein
MKEDLFEVGCFECGKGGFWKIFTDGNTIVKAKCLNCEHEVFIEGKTKINTDIEYVKKEKEKNVRDARLF